MSVSGQGKIILPFPMIVRSKPASTFQGRCFHEKNAVHSPGVCRSPVLSHRLRRKADGADEAGDRKGPPRRKALPGGAPVQDGRGSPGPIRCRDRQSQGADRCPAEGDGPHHVLQRLSGNGNAGFGEGAAGHTAGGMDHPRPAQGESGVLRSDLHPYRSGPHPDDPGGGPVCLYLVG